MSSKPQTTTTTTTTTTEKRSGGALDHVSSPRKRTMHRRSPPLEKQALLHGARAPCSPFPPSPGERAFGDRVRFLKAVEATCSWGNVLVAAQPSLGLRGLCGLRGLRGLDVCGEAPAA